MRILKIFLFFLYPLLSVSSLFAQTSLNIPTDYPSADTVIKQIKTSPDILAALQGLGLGFGLGESITVKAYNSERENLPATLSANVVVYKASIDYPKRTDNSHQRVLVAIFYKREITAIKTGPWQFGGIRKNLCWFDQAHIIDTGGNDITQQKNSNEIRD
ncbi:MAG: hypothetical protein CVU05_08445 [Bacteroidetes bacterium HGW-Bacteroidetes-21]|jgi:hypothetical protein|nr:MAG: hypothetical protein CVU05_08445 [Bacteroidetes bacterium HGW-Bacteroidetes-21]